MLLCLYAPYHTYSAPTPVKLKHPCFQGVQIVFSKELLFLLRRHDHYMVLHCNDDNIHQYVWILQISIYFSLFLLISFWFSFYFSPPISHGLACISSIWY